MPARLIYSGLVIWATIEMNKVKQALQKEYSEMIENEGRFRPEFIHITKLLLETKKLDRYWPVLLDGFENKNETELIKWIRLAIIHGTSTLSSNRMTRKNKATKSTKLYKLIKTMVPIIKELDFDFDIYFHLPAEAKKALLLGTSLNRESMLEDINSGLINPILVDFNKDIAVSPTLTDVLLEISEILYSESELTDVAVKNTAITNFKELYFIRTIYTFIYEKFQRPLIPFIQALVDVFFPDNELGSTYVKDRIQEMKRP